MSARAAAAAMRSGWLETRPQDDVRVAPMSDGGPGFVDALQASVGGTLRQSSVVDVLGRPVVAKWLEVDGVGYIESGEAAGLHLIPTDQRDVMQASSFGVGQLIADAVSYGCTRIVVGVGGTGCSDGGAGLLAALGATAAGAGLDTGPAGLVGVSAVDLTPAARLLDGIDVEICTDVDNPLLGARGAAATFAPQKGASAEQVAGIESAVTALVTAIGRNAEGKDPAVMLGAGAGGGIGYALLALGGRRTSGIQRIIDISGITAAITSSDL